MRNNSTLKSKILSFRKNHVILIDKNQSIIIKYGNPKIENLLELNTKEKREREGDFIYGRV